MKTVRTEFVLNEIDSLIEEVEVEKKKQNNIESELILDDLKNLKNRIKLASAN